MKVIELARRAGVTPETVRHYARVGLLTPTRDPGNGYRHFSQRDVARVCFIRNAAQLGFHLSEIAEVIAAADSGHSACPQVRRILEHRIEETRDRLRALSELQHRMEAALADWAELPDRQPDAGSICHLIEQHPPVTGESDGAPA